MRTKSSIDLMFGGIEVRMKSTILKNERAAMALRAIVVAWVGVYACMPSCCAADVNSMIDFTRDVRPILANNCFHCHGPDADERQAELRLDVWRNDGDVRGGESVIAGGNPAKSELITRITSEDESFRMPPADSGKSLSPDQIATLKTWISQGAKYRRHWAFVPPQRPKVPEVKLESWVRNPIDAFVLVRLEHEGLAPSPPANMTSLLRRLSLDLIGLPPTPEEVEAFRAADGERPYEDEVERLLVSPHFGERWGRVWLDAARYADSDGFEKDKPRSVWMYRDWVVNAFNQDLPYDQFIIEQIAGDLLSNPSQDQMVATGFLRNSMLNEEGGVDPEQFRMEAMFDRMDAVGKSILGLTVQCAQCHTHKYDPLTHTDYYRMFAFLNNCHEAQMTVYTPQQESEWRSTLEIIQQIENQLRVDNPDWPERMQAWEKSVTNDQPEWIIVRPKDDRSGDQKHFVLDDSSVLAAGYAPTRHWPKFSAEVKLPKITAVRLELLTDSNLPRGGPGRSIFGTGALTEFQIEATPIDGSAAPTRLKFARASADINPPVREVDKLFDNRSGERRVTGPIQLAVDGDNNTAWGIDIGPGRSNMPRKAVFVLEKPLEVPVGVRLSFILVQYHGGANSNDNQNNNLGRFRFSVTSADNPVADPLPAEVRAVLQVPPDQRTPEQTARVFSYWRTTVAEWQDENRRIEALWQSHPLGATQLVLMERTSERVTSRLERGNYLSPAEAVTRGVPAFLHALREPLSSTTHPSRLDFARWLADRRSPTTARSIVNRIWQAYFGIGLCETTEDLGTQGASPTHPELLDWLALELMDHNWSLKHIHRLIVTSATYRQASKLTPQLLNRDPANRLLARGPRQRVDAEIVRDIALTVSGLLNRKLGGPSVYPPVPEFLFKPPASFAEKSWPLDTGPDRFRRGLYTFRFRSVPYPALQNFDAPIGEVACVRRSQSNTPLQALTILNEPLFLECARSLALRTMTEGGPTDADRINYAFKLCLSREPLAAEQDALEQFIRQERKRLARKGTDPWLIMSDDLQSKDRLAAKLPLKVTPIDAAAWTALSRVLLSLDETITKE